MTHNEVNEIILIWKPIKFRNEVYNNTSLTLAETTV